jgi:hypothetical protein
MMGVRKPETCRAVNKQQNNKLELLLHLFGDLLNGTVFGGLELHTVIKHHTQGVWEIRPLPSRFHNYRTTHTCPVTFVFVAHQ